MQKYSRIIFSCSGWSPYSKGVLGCSGCGKFELLCLNENIEVYIPENDNDAGKTYRLVLKSISNKKISARIEDESYWKKVAYFYGKCSKLMYDMIIEKYVNTQLKVIKK